MGLRELFGPSKDEIWKQLSQELGGEFVDGGFWKKDRVVARVGEWTVTLDTYTVSTGHTHVTYTRIRTPYVNPDGFRFSIRRRSLFSGIGKLLGMQDIEVGDAEFDHEFILKGNDASKVRALFANARIRQLVQTQPSIGFEVKDDEGWFGARFPEGVDELCFQVTGVIKDLERLRSLFDLFSETLQQLCRMGSAYEDEPRVTL